MLSQDYLYWALSRATETNLVGPDAVAQKHLGPKTADRKSARHTQFYERIFGECRPTTVFFPLENNQITTPIGRFHKIQIQSFVGEGFLENSS